MPCFPRAMFFVVEVVGHRFGSSVGVPELAEADLFAFTESVDGFCVSVRPVVGPHAIRIAFVPVIDRFACTVRIPVKPTSEELATLYGALIFCVSIGPVVGPQTLGVAVLVRTNGREFLVGVPRLPSAGWQAMFVVLNCFGISI